VKYAQKGIYEIAVYWFFTAGEQLKMLKLPSANAESTWEDNGEHRREMRLFAKAFSRMDDCKQTLVLHLAQKMARHRTRI
jgi:hypothetical protein